MGIPGTVEPVLDESAVRETVALVKAVREAVGPDIKLMVDCHAKPTPPVALRLAHEVAPYNLLFLEEPIPPENVDALATVARSSPVPIATGERLFTRHGFREVVEKQAPPCFSRTWATPEASWRRRRSPRWPRPTTSRWPRTTPAARASRWPACTSLPVHPTS